MTTHPDVTSFQEQAAQTEAQEVVGRLYPPRWAFTLIGAGLLAVTAGWCYLLNPWGSLPLASSLLVVPGPAQARDMHIPEDCKGR